MSAGATLQEHSLRVGPQSRAWHSTSLRETNKVCMGQDDLRNMNDRFKLRRPKSTQRRDKTKEECSSFGGDEQDTVKNPAQNT